MTSGMTTPWLNNDNTIGMPSDTTADKNINILGVVMLLTKVSTTPLVMTTSSSTYSS